jgi:hypothetical protein
MASFMRVGSGSSFWWAGALLALLGVSGCAPGIGGRASFPVLSTAKIPPNFEKVADVEETRCTHIVLFFWAWGEDENHEALVTEALEKHKGDALVDAELTFTNIPAIVYNQTCAVLKGTVVRRSSGSAQAASAANLQGEASR